MEQIQSGLDEKVGMSASTVTLSTNLTTKNDGASYDRILLDVGSYLDEFNEQSRISRRASNPIVLMNAIAVEAAEKAGLKEEARPILLPRLLSFKSSSDNPCNMGVFEVLPSMRNTKIETAVSGLQEQLRVANAENVENIEVTCTEYVDWLKFEFDEQLTRLKEDIKALKSYTLPANNGHTATSYLGMTRDVKLIEMNERFDGLQSLSSVVFKQIRDMFGLVNASTFELRWEHELQGEVSSIVITDCVRGLQDELDGRFYQQSNVMNTMSRNWEEKATEITAMRDELAAVSKMLLPPEAKLQGTPSKHDHSGETSGRWKNAIIGKIMGEDRARASHEENSQSSSEENEDPVIESSTSSKELISEKSDFRHLKNMTKEETINYFKNEIGKLKREHEKAMLKKTEEVFKLKRQKKGTSASKKDKESEPMRNKILDIVSRMEKLLEEDIKVPVEYSMQDDTDEIYRLKGKNDSLYYENQHLRGILMDKTKEVKQLSSQLSEANKKISLHSSLEANLLRQVEKNKTEYEDLQTECSVRDKLNWTITRDMIHDCSTSTQDVLVTSLEIELSETKKALCLANEENEKLKKQIAGLQQDLLDQSCQESNVLGDYAEKQVIISDSMTETDPLGSRLNKRRTSQRNLEYELELTKLNQMLEFASSVLEDAEKKNSVLNGILTKEKEEEKQSETITTSMTDLSREFAEIEDQLIMSSKGDENRLGNLSDQCNRMVQQAIILTKKGMWYKQMLGTRRCELQKAESEVDFLGDKVNALLSLLQKIHVTLDQYSPVFQRYPGLLDAFLKTSKLSAALKATRMKTEKVQNKLDDVVS